MVPGRLILQNITGFYKCEMGFALCGYKKTPRPGGRRARAFLFCRGRSVNLLALEAETRRQLHRYHSNRTQSK